MSPGKQEQKTPTEDELEDFERRKNVPPAAPLPSSQYMPSNSRSRGGWSVLTGFAVVGLLLGGVAVSFMTMRSSKLSSSAPTPIPSEPMMAPPATSATSIHEVAIAEVLQQPTRYIGDKVYVTATFKRKISPRAFIVSDGKSELLVVDLDNNSLNRLPDQMRFYGRIRDARGVPSDLRRDYKGAVYLDTYGFEENR